MSPTSWQLGDHVTPLCFVLGFVLYLAWLFWEVRKARTGDDQ